MLKFRMTNSMKARRAAEAQRKTLEEKLKMEWAWKPMAAVMNEKESDLVYWVPPLYTSNLLTSFSSSSSFSSSLTSSPSSSFKRSSVRHPPSSLSEALPVRRRKLAQRRSKLSLEQSTQGTKNEVSGRCKDEDKRKKDEATTDEDKESGIQDEYPDSSVDEDETMNKTNYLRYSLKNLDKQKKLPKKREKFKHIPTLLKVIDKLSQIYTLPITPPPPMYGSMRPQRPKEFRSSTNRKPRRPSVKIYRVPSQRLSLRKNKQEEEEEAEQQQQQQQQPYYVITKSKSPFNNLQQRSSVRSKNSSDRTHIGLPTLTENELRSAHLEMILRILTDLYEEKITHQNTEISHLKSKLQLQEKVVKQTAQLVLDLKDQMRTLQAKMDFNEELKKFYGKHVADNEPSFPYHPLEPLVEETNESQKSQISVPVVDADEISSENPSEIKDEICETHSENSKTTQENKEEKEKETQSSILTTEIGKS